MNIATIAVSDVGGVGGGPVDGNWRVRSGNFHYLTLAAGRGTDTFFGREFLGKFHLSPWTKRRGRRSGSEDREGRATGESTVRTFSILRRLALSPRPG